MEGKELSAWCALARECQCSMIFDEFYSHYIYTNGKPKTEMVSAAAEFVEDVERDPIIIVDGLTKNWRYPGWRISWTLGPKEVIEATMSVGCAPNRNVCAGRGLIWKVGMVSSA